MGHESALRVLGSNELDTRRIYELLLVMMFLSLRTLFCNEQWRDPEQQSKDPRLRQE